MSYHAKASPSGAHQWRECTASIKEQEGKPDNAGDDTRWGTAAHLVSETAIKDKADTSLYQDMVVRFWVHPESESSGVSLHEPHDEMDGNVEVLHTIPVDQEMVEATGQCVNFVRQLVKATGGTLMTEQALPIDHITGEEGATGTGDITILAGDEIISLDFKFGVGVKVDAYHEVEPEKIDIWTGEITAPVLEPNPQLTMYGSGALRQFGLFGDYKRVRMIVLQPRIAHTSEHVMTVDALEEFVQVLGKQARIALSGIDVVYAPGDACRFCRAKATCSALQAHVMADMPDELTKETKPSVFTVGQIYQRSSLIKSYLEACEEHVRQELIAGREVMGEKEPLKLVQGNLGQRVYTDTTAAEEMLRKQFRLKVEDAYELKVKSPKQVEDMVVAGTLGQRQWNKLQKLITQNRNKPSIVPLSDKRPALAGLADDMPTVE